MKAIGVVDFTNIPTGLLELDKVLKFNEVKIYKAGAICPGKYYFIIYGDNNSIENALKNIKGAKCKQIISGVSEKLIRGFERKKDKNDFGAIGVAEFFNIADGIKILDIILKENDVEVLKIVLGMTLAGKCYFVISGTLSSINQAIEHISNLPYKKVDISKINNPSEDILKYI